MDNFADAILSGLICADCQAPLEGAAGHPRTCPACLAAARKAHLEHAKHKRHRRKHKRPHKRVVHRSRG